MPQVLKRPQAETDLDEIWWHIAKTTRTMRTGSSIRSKNDVRRLHNSHTWAQAEKSFCPHCEASRLAII